MTTDRFPTKEEYLRDFGTKKKTISSMGDKWILEPDEILPQQGTKVKQQEYYSLGLTVNQYNQVIDSWIQDRIKPEDMKEYLSQGQRFVDFGLIDDPMQFVRLEVADIVGFKELGLSSEKAHELTNKLFPGLRSKFAIPQVEPSLPMMPTAAPMGLVGGKPFDIKEPREEIPYPLKNTETNEDIIATLRTSDSTVWLEGERIGTANKDGEFAPKEPTLWDKVLFYGSKALNIALYPLIKPARITGEGMFELTSSSKEDWAERKDLEESLIQRRDERIVQDPDLRQEIIDEYAPLLFDARSIPGKKEEYEGLPWYKQLMYESPFWLALGATGISATGARGALAPAATRGGFVGGVAKTTQAVLAPAAAVEAAPAVAVKYGIVIPAKYAAKGVSATGKKAFEAALDAGLDKWIVQKGVVHPDYQNSVIKFFLSKNSNWLYRKGQENLIKRMAERRGESVAARMAAEDTVVQAETRLLSAVKGAEVPAEVKPVAKPVVPETPVGKPTPEVVPEPLFAKDIEPIVKKWEVAKARNSTSAQKDIDALKAKGYEIDDVQEALGEYKNIIRSDYDSTEEFSEARSDAWESFISELDNISPREVVVPKTEVGMLEVKPPVEPTLAKPKRLTSLEQVDASFDIVKEELTKRTGMPSNIIDGILYKVYHFPEKIDTLYKTPISKGNRELSAKLLYESLPLRFSDASMVEGTKGDLLFHIGRWKSGGIDPDIYMGSMSPLTDAGKTAYKKEVSNLVNEVHDIVKASLPTAKQARVRFLKTTIPKLDVKSPVAPKKVAKPVSETARLESRRTELNDLLAKPAKDRPKGITEKMIRQELKQVSEKLVPAEKKLRQQIMATVKSRSISDKLRDKIFKRIGGTHHLSEIKYSNLQKILPAIQKARPERIKGKVLITTKTEESIQSWKSQLIEQKKITEQDYSAILRMLKLPTDKYVNESQFITEKDGKKIIKAMRRKSLMGFSAIEERVAELSKALGPPAKLPPVITGSALEKTPLNRFQDKLSGFLNRTYRVERILLKLDEYTEGGLFQKTFYKPLNEATSQKLNGVYSRIEELRGLLKANNINLGKMSTDKIEIMPDVILTPSEKIGVYLHSLNPDNLRHLKAGNKFSDELIETVKLSLTDSEKKIAEWLHDFFQAEGSSISQARLYVEEKPLDLVKDYFPIRLDWRAEPEIDYWGQISKSDSMDFISRWASGGIPKGFLKERTHEAIQAVDLDALGIFLNHLEMVEHYKAFAPVISDLQLIMKNQMLKSTLTNKAGISTYQVLDKWLRQVAEINPLRPTNHAESILRTLRVNAVTAVLGLNLTTALKQFPSFVSGLAEIGIMPGIKGLVTFMAHPNETRQLIKQYDMQTYRRSFEREIAEAKKMRGVTGVLGGKLSPKEAFMFLTVSMDKIAVSGLWRGAFDDFLSKNPTDFKGAAEVASKVIRKTQPYFDIKDLPEYYRSGEFMKALTIFTNQLNQYWNYYRFDIFGKRAAGKISTFETLKRIFLAWVVPALMIGAISRSDVQRSGKDAVKDLAGMAFATVPIMGNLITSGMKGFSDSGIITTEILDRIQELSYNINEKEWGQALLSLPEVAGYAGGIPVAQPKRTIKASINLAQGKTDDWMELIWGEYTRQQAIVTGFEKAEDKLEWDKLFDDYYNSSPASSDRYDYRELNPQTDAALFITNRVSTLQSDLAKLEVLRIIEKYELDVSEIKGYEKEILGIEPLPELPELKD